MPRVPTKMRTRVKRKPSYATTKTFDTFFAKLNRAQKQAVETIEGPVMVVAGPGTGKTQVLALRVANILKNTHAKPGSILCLTFSQSGATAMRERLRTIIGSDAYGVTISTIHGFCDDFILQHPHVFERWSAMKRISDIERYREVNKIIDQLMPDLLLINRKSPYSRTPEIISRISQLKREGVTERDTLLGIAARHGDMMERKSRAGTKAHQHNIDAATKFEELLEIFFLYQDMLEKSQRYDYDDMILYVLEALKQEDWLLASLQERYLYILVDEFQDLNGAQFKFVDLLTRDPTGDDVPNLFVVGDDDQAIYRFQGANLQHILSFHKRFPQASVIPLTVSYRCSQAILDAAAALIAHNEERLVGEIPGLTKDLTSAVDARGKKPSLLLSVSDRTEPWLIADIVEDRVQGGMDSHDIAIFTYKNSELPPLYDVLRARGIPVEMTGKIDLLSQPKVLQAIAILRAAFSPEDSALLAGALGCDSFGCNGADLGRLYIQRMEERTNLLQVLLKAESLEGMHDLKAIISARDTILDLHKHLQSRTIVQTFDALFRESGLIPKNIGKKGIDPLAYVPAFELFERIQARALEEPSYSVKEFLGDIEYYMNREYGELRMSFDIPHVSQRGVQLMTAHQSKGLEFRTVILSNFRHKHWDERRNPPSISVPEDLLFGWESEVKKYHQTQDERRLAYVAMTRAKEEVVFTCPKELTLGDRNREVSPSGFVSECGDISEELAEVRDPTAVSTFLFAPRRAIDKEYETFLLERVENFRLSPTALNDFLHDPELFRDRHLLRKPEKPHPVLAFGNAVHHALAKWGLKVMEGELLSLEEFIAVCTEHLRTQEVLTDLERRNYEAEAHETLTRYFQDALQPPYPVIDSIERSLRAHVGDIPLKGKIDRIDLREPNSRTAIVTDYKTGRPKTNAQIEEFGYKRQLVFYALLMEASPAIIVEPQEYRLEFLGDRTTEAKTLSYTVTEEEKRELRKTIRAVWEKIEKLDFTPLS